MAKVGVERFSPCHRKEYGANGHEGRAGRMAEKVRDVERVDRRKNAWIVREVPQSGKSDREKPQRGDWSKYGCDPACSETLNRKQHCQNKQRQRHDIRIEGRRYHFKAFDRREHRDRRCYDGVAEE